MADRFRALYHLALARAALLGGRIGEGRIALMRSLAYDPDLTDAAQALACLDQGAIPPLPAWTVSVESVRLATAHACNALIDGHLAKDRIELAEAAFRAGLGASVNAPLSNLRMVRGLLRHGHGPVAARYYRQALGATALILPRRWLALDCGDWPAMSDSADSHLVRAGMAVSLDLRAAAGHAARAVSAEPGAADLVLLEAVLLRDLGDYETAEARFASLVRDDPSIEHLCQWSLTLSVMRRAEPAAEAARLAMALDPDLPWPICLLALGRYAGGDKEEGWRVLTSSAQKLLHDAWSLVLVSMIHIASGRHDPARRMLLNVVKDPWLGSWAWSALALAYDGLDEPEHAEFARRTAQAATPWCGNMEARIFALLGG